MGCSGCIILHPPLSGPLLLATGLLWEVSSWRDSAPGHGGQGLVDRLTYSEVDSEISWCTAIVELLSWSDALIGIHRDPS